MSYIVSVVVLDPRPTIDPSHFQTRDILLQAASQGPDARWNACYLKALWRRLGASYLASGFYIVTDVGGGYFTSSPFVHIPEDEKPAIVCFPAQCRQDVFELLETLMKASSIGSLLFLCEPTFSAVGSIPEQRYESYDIEPAMNLLEFQVCHDRGSLVDQTIYRISG